MAELTLNEYQRLALRTAVYPQPIIYPTLGLVGESGEVAEKVKKVLRDNNSVFTDEKKFEIMTEVSDVLWYCATLANDLGFTLGEVGEYNVAKLQSRVQRNKIHGNGDFR